jgi:hypothetical protein
MRSFSAEGTIADPDFGPPATMPLPPPKSSATSFPPLWFVLVVPALAAIALYAPTLAAGFLSDDYSHLHAFDGCEGVRGFSACVAHLFVSGMSAPSYQYRPLGTASFALNSMLSAAPYFWHLVNVGLHAANAALVALLAAQLMVERTTHARYAALAAGWLFAWFAPGVEAVAWVAARFDGLALFFMLTAGCAFIASRRWNDGFAFASLMATIFAFLSKEAAAIGIVLIVALAWWKQPSGAGFIRNALRAPVVAAPWLLIAAAYFVWRALLFGDAFRVYAGVSPLRALVTGEWLVALPGIVAWSGAALPETEARIAFAFSALALGVCAIVAGMRERTAARALCVVVITVAISFALVLAQLRWPPNGEGGRVLYAIGAIALPGLTLPLAAAGPRLRFLAWVSASVLLGSEYTLAQAAIERWVQAGADARALATALADTAAATPAEGYAFVVIPDHLGAIPFGRNAQGGLILPPVQARPLSSKLIVQTPDGLAQWPDLFERDIVGRLRRESLGSVVANLRPPKVPPPHALPDRYFCWSPRAGALVRLPVIDETGLAHWDATWARALLAAKCE